jgi:hypothetical protein
MRRHASLGGLSSIAPGVQGGGKWLVLCEAAGAYRLLLFVCGLSASGVVRSFLASGISSRRNRRAEREVPGANPA